LTGSFSKSLARRSLKTGEKPSTFGVSDSHIYEIKSFKPVAEKGGLPDASSYKTQPNAQISE
jgi:hypothetical protein